MPSPRAVVVGGSIGGLAAAIALRAAGADVTVLERSPALIDGGGGIVLQPGVEEFLRRHELGSGDTVGVPSERRRDLDRDGTEVRGEQTRQLMTSYGALVGALQAGVDATDDLDLRHGVTVTDVSPDATVTAGDERWAADLVVAADGAGSTVRGRLLPDVGPAYAGYVAWRGVVPEAELTAELATAFSGSFTFFTAPDDQPGMQILAYLIPGADGSVAAGGRRLNWVWYQPVHDLAGHLVDAEGHGHDWSLPAGTVSEQQRDRQRRHARDRLPPVFADLVERTAQPFVQAITDLESPRMTVGRVALLGDAAAVPRPHTAYGSAKAVDDARALADAVIAHPGDLDAALAAWEPQQQRLAHDVVGLGQQLGDRFGLRAES